MTGQDPQHNQERPPTDLRAYRRQSERRTVLLILFVLVVVGDVLIGIVFGAGMMLTALPWLALFGIGIGALYLLLGSLDRWSR